MPILELHLASCFASLVNPTLMGDSAIPNRSGHPPFVQPVLRALDRLKDQPEVLGPDQLMERARSLVESDDAQVGFAYAPTGILGEHTHYFDGFALLMPLPLGAAVALAPDDGAGLSIEFDGGTRTWSTSEKSGAGDMPIWVRLVRSVVEELRPGESFRIAVATSVFPQCFDAYMSSLAAATARAVLGSAVGSEVDRAVIVALRDMIKRVTSIPFGASYVIGALHGEPGRPFLVDAATFEYLTVESPPDDDLAWCLIQAGRGPVHEPAYYQDQALLSERALKEMQNGAFPELASFRELEHRHLEMALEEIGAPRRAIVRHLVTENRRVQKMIVALRKGDWQFAGALLLMSHGSMANDWGSTSPDADRVVSEVELMSIEGMHGACMSSRGGCVIMCGRRFVLPQFLDTLVETFRADFGYEPSTIVL
jgi:galactokinase